MRGPDQGKILVGEFDHSYVVKMRGYIRLTLCASLGRYMERIFGAEDHPRQVLIDLSDATGLDSTTLGLIARLALYCQDHFHFKPLVFCDRAELLQDLHTMALDEFLDIVSRTPPQPQEMRELPVVDASAQELKKRIIDAHKLLASLNPQRESEFLDLVRAIERDVST
jgi:anti-anti-sigma regulatory factor